MYLGLGSNLGDREANLLKAITMIGERIGNVVRQSTFMETEPWGFESKNAFLNATQKIERALGRKKKSLTSHPIPEQSSPTRSLSPLTPREYHDRPIDIDILLYDDLELDEPDLKIPHPLMHQRDFVMIPLQELTK